jgi:hypothetical protein
MGLRSWFRRARERLGKRKLADWYHVSFDDKGIFIRAEPPGRDPWQQQLAWSSIERIAYQCEDMWTSDGIYVFTRQRPESYVIPIEAEGGFALWEEILRRRLFDPELSMQAAQAHEGLFVWPPPDSHHRPK